VSISILACWIVLYVQNDPKTHLGAFFGNAIADWTGVLATVIATKYFYEVGSGAKQGDPASLRSGQVVFNDIVQYLHRARKNEPNTASTRSASASKLSIVADSVSLNQRRTTTD
jgi:hypothetical protein